MNKIDIRKKARQILVRFSHKEIASYSSVISQSVFSLIQKSYSTQSLIIGGYMPLFQEVKWFLAFENSHYHLSIPHIYDEEKMDYFEVFFSDIKLGKHGLRLQDECREIRVNPEVLLIPGLAFTKEGKRLGRGKGYFDRYLKNFKGLKIGICFEKQLFQDIPTDQYDQKVDLVITEKNIYKNNKGK